VATKKSVLRRAEINRNDQNVRVSDVISLFARIMMFLGTERSEIVDVIAKTNPVKLPKSVKLMKASLFKWGPILSRWANDPLFLDERGRPRDLPFSKSKAVSFSDLVELELPGESPEHCRDVLIAIDSIVELPSGALRWLQRDLITKRDSAETLFIDEFLLPINSLLSSLEVGLTDKAPNMNVAPFQRAVSGFELYPDDIVAFRGMLSRHGMAFLEIMDDWLTQRTRRRKQVRGKNAFRPNIGLFMSLEPVKTVAKTKKKSTKRKKATS